MILYLTGEENINLFDYLMEDGKDVMIKKYCGEFELKKFIVHDSRNLNPFDIFLVDLEALSDKEDDLISALIAFSALYDSRLILYAEKTTRGLLERIIEEANVFNIITAMNPGKVKEQMKLCMSNHGMNKEQVIRNVNKDLDADFILSNPYSFIGENVKIMVCGAMDRAGTTTAALNLAIFLTGMGARVSYTEANNSGHLQMIHEHFFFNNPVEDGAFSGEGVSYYFKGNIPSEGFNFNIIDLGMVNEANAKALSASNINILCAGTKPYEIPYLKAATDRIGKGTFFLYLPAGSDLDHKEMGIGKERIVYHKYAHLFDGMTNREAFKKMLGNHVFLNKVL